MSFMFTEQPDSCPWCKKPNCKQWMFRHNGTGYEQIPMHGGFIMPPDFFCQGHSSYWCSVCGWNVIEGYHPTEECVRLVGIGGKRQTAIPHAFYAAFGDAHSEQP